MFYFDEGTDINIDQVNVQEPGFSGPCPSCPSRVQATGVSGQANPTPSFLLAYQVGSSVARFDAALSQWPESTPAFTTTNGAGGRCGPM